MKRTMTTCAAFAVAAMLNAPAFAQDPMPPVPPQEMPSQEAPAESATATGELLEIDPEAMTLKIKGADDETWSFRYTPQTVIVGSEEGIAGLATTEGVLVTVHFDEADGERTATRIDIDERR